MRQNLNTSQASSTNELERLMEKTKLKKEVKYEMFVGNNTIDFDINDKIFLRTGPNNSKMIGSKNCVSCSKVFKDNKSSQYCQFCGSRACKTCMFKQREFVGGETSIKKQNLSEVNDIYDDRLKTILTNGSKSPSSTQVS